MAKAVLVIDMPESCLKCRFYENTWLACRAVEKQILFDKPKPEWCPLRELPKYKRQYGDNGNTIVKNAGFNECLDEVLGKE